MPIYEYECASCQHRLEKIQKLSDSKLVDCPECGEPDLRKLVSAAAFRLKGSGWYETDFKTGSKKNVSGGDSGSTDSGGSSNSTTSGSASTESKSADKGTKSKPASTGD
jgi:putative FmdB family regulatory protein